MFLLDLNPFSSLLSFSATHAPHLSSIMVAALPPDRFLTQLHKMFERTKASGAVTLTTKRSELKLMGEKNRSGALSLSLSHIPSRAHHLTSHTGNMKNKRARKPDEVRMSEQREGRGVERERWAPLASIGLPNLLPFALFFFSAPGPYLNTHFISRYLSLSLPF